MCDAPRCVLYRGANVVVTRPGTAKNIGTHLYWVGYRDTALRAGKCILCARPRLVTVRATEVLTLPFCVTFQSRLSSRQYRAAFFNANVFLVRRRLQFS